MPLVFGLLVVFNAVFLAWQFFEQQNRAQAPITVVEDQQGTRLQLVSERSDLAAVVTAAANASEEAAPFAKTTVADSATCYRVGPFVDHSMLKQVKAAFEKSGFDIKVISMTNNGVNHWVYIPPLSSPDKAQAVLAELQKAGVSATVVTDSQLANAISLGNFASAESADALRARLMDLGYRAETRATQLNRDESWLLLLNAGDVAKVQADRILAGSPKIRRETAPCQ